jgi:hypothetical protein
MTSLILVLVVSIALELCVVVLCTGAGGRTDSGRICNYVFILTSTHFSKTQSRSTKIIVVLPCFAKIMCTPTNTKEDLRHSRYHRSRTMFVVVTYGKSSC